MLSDGVVVVGIVVFVVSMVVVVGEVGAVVLGVVVGVLLLFVALLWLKRSRRLKSECETPKRVVKHSLGMKPRASSSQNSWIF